jgi:hypothetical protein
MSDALFWGHAGHLRAACGLLRVMPLKVMDMAELRLQVIQPGDRPHYAVYVEPAVWVHHRL